MYLLRRGNRIVLFSADQPGSPTLRGDSFSYDGQRPVKDSQADDFRARDVRAVTDAFGRKEQRAGGIGDAGFLPFAGQDVSPFVRVWMRVRRNRVSGLELAQHDDSAGALVLVQDHQLNPFIRTGLPGFVFGQRDVRKHDFIEADRAGFASAAESTNQFSILKQRRSSVARLRNVLLNILCL